MTAEQNTRPLNRRSIRGIIDLTRALDTGAVDPRAVAVACEVLNVPIVDSTPDTVELITRITLHDGRVPELRDITRLHVVDPLDLALEALALERDGMRRVWGVLHALGTVESARIPQTDTQAAKRIAQTILQLDSADLAAVDAAARLISGDVPTGHAEPDEEPEGEPAVANAPEATALAPATQSGIEGTAPEREVTSPDDTWQYGA